MAKKSKFQCKDQLNLFDLLGEVGQKVKESIEKCVIESVIKPITRKTVDFINNISQSRVVEKQNFKTDKNLMPVKPKERFSANIDGVRLIKSLTEKNEPATHKEQLVLAQFSGWGGLTDYFKEGKNYDILKNLLTEQELMQANRSLLDAYYTNNDLARIVWYIVTRMGFEDGVNRSILDPSMGTGAFYSVMPDSLHNANLYGVELEALPTQISKALFPNAIIRNCGFQTLSLSKKYDLIISNIPFGDHQIYDRKKELVEVLGSETNLVHDYFIMKGAMLLKEGGIMAVITSSGTMERSSNGFRSKLAEHVQLAFAFKLPNNMFSGTSVSAEILIFVKTKTQYHEWVSKDQSMFFNQYINAYYCKNQTHVLGTLEQIRKQYGYEIGVVSERTPEETIEYFSELVKTIAFENGPRFFAEQDIPKSDEGQEDDGIEIPPGLKVKSDTFCMYEEGLYFVEGTKMYLQGKPKPIITDFIKLREITYRLLQEQTDGEEESADKARTTLNHEYDRFVKKYGAISLSANARILSKDMTYYTVAALEDAEDVDGIEVYKKGIIMYQNTLIPVREPQTAESVSEALKYSLSYLCRVDLDYISFLTSKNKKEILEELKGEIFLNPVIQKYEHKSIYLSGNIKEKIEMSKAFNISGEYDINIEHLENVYPEKLTIGDIYFNIGSSWVPKEIYEEYMFFASKTKHTIEYDSSSAKYRVVTSNKISLIDKTTYGTEIVPFPELFEKTMNNSIIKIDMHDNNGKVVGVNKNETIAAREKQAFIREDFSNWVVQNPTISNKLEQIYNERFNIYVPKKYEIDTLPLKGLALPLRKHQLDAAFRIAVDGKCLLAHEVGAGKTATMIAAAMYMIQTGLISKPMFVVPNAVIDGWAIEIKKFFPLANMLVVTKDDFAKENRRRFIGKVAVGKYDGIVIAQSQFKMISLSPEKEEEYLCEQLNEILWNIQMLEADKNGGSYFSKRQLAKKQESIQNQIEALQDRKANEENMVYFEDLGVDFLFVDESQAYKNLYTPTSLKLAGMSTSASNQAFDMFLKIKYMYEKYNGRGLVFATGTPIANSVSDIYTMFKYFIPDVLTSSRLTLFDQWASAFGKIITSHELSPEGNKMRSVQRFQKYLNLPELMKLYWLFADVKTNEVLDLNLPKRKELTVEIEPNEYQKMIMKEFIERAEKIRSNAVEPNEDNMLKLTGDAKSLALSPRLLDEEIPYEGDKIKMCVENVARIYHQTTKSKSTQIVFSDIGTPKKGKYDVYNTIKGLLIQEGVVAEQIAFVHDAKTDKQKANLFRKVRKGVVRVVIGSSFKLGTGVNVQNRIAAVHHIDVPWRPMDIIQREGRAIRQGNENGEVMIYRYVTKGTFDAYLWQIIENKLIFISQVMTNKSPSRSCDEINDAILSAAEVKAIAIGDPRIAEKFAVDNEISKLKIVRANYLREMSRVNDIIENGPARIERITNAIANNKDTIEKLVGGTFVINGQVYNRDSEAINAMIAYMTEVNHNYDLMYAGLDVELKKINNEVVKVEFCGHVLHDSFDYYTPRKLVNRLLSFSESLSNTIIDQERRLEEWKKSYSESLTMANKPFAQQEELDRLLAKQAELALALEFHENGNEEQIGHTA